jgi:DNA-binding response OmpR family regulator
MEKTRVLVVDDEEEICQTTKSFLTKRNYDVSIARNSQETISALEKSRPHLVFLDIRLGNESGLDLLRKIKEADKKVKVIMVTALNDDASIRQAKALGADDYISKPFTADYLDDLILQKIAGLSVKTAKK